MQIYNRLAVLTDPQGIDHTRGLTVYSDPTARWPSVFTHFTFPRRSRWSTLPNSRSDYLFFFFPIFRGNLEMELCLQNLQHEASRTTCEHQRNHWMSQVMTYKVRQLLQNPFHPSLHPPFVPVSLRREKAPSVLLLCAEGVDQLHGLK